MMTTDEGVPKSRACVKTVASGLTQTIAVGAPSVLPPPTGEARPVNVTSGCTPCSGNAIAGGVTGTLTGIATPGGIVTRTGWAVQPEGASTVTSTASGSLVQLPAVTTAFTGLPANRSFGTVSADAVTSGTSTGTPSGMNSAAAAKLLRAPVAVRRILRTSRAGVVSFAVFISSEAPQVLVRTVVNVVPSVLTAIVYAVMWPFRTPSKRGW